MKKLVAFGMALVVSACTASPPVQEFASENGITLKYSAYDSVPTLTAEAREEAVQHCARYGKLANYLGGNAVNAFSTEETHQFACENKKTDDSRVVAAQSQRPTYVPVPVFNAPTQTSCTTVGITTKCSTY